MTGKRPRTSRFGEGEIPSPNGTTLFSSDEDVDISSLNFLLETSEEMPNAGDAANPNAWAVKNARSKHKGDRAWEKSTYPCSVEGTSNCVSHEPAAMGCWDGHVVGNPNPYVQGGRPDVGHSYVPGCCGLLCRNIESMHEENNAGAQNNNHFFNNRPESRGEMFGCNAKKQATDGEASCSYYPPKLEFLPPENHQNHGYGDNLNNRNVMDATLPTQHALIISNSITSLQPCQISAVANNTQHTSNLLSVIEKLIKSMVSSHLASNGTNPTLGVVQAGNGDGHSALDVEPLQMCMLRHDNDGQITLRNKIMLPTEEADIPKDSKQANPGKKRTNGSMNEGRKCCSCKKSGCLKLYCECFAAEQFCNQACKCNGCSNNASNEEMILANKRKIKNRNPHAFSPKFVHGNGEPAEIGKERASTTLWHKRGCNCMKSKCQKKYCECYQAGVGCSSECRCENCENAYGKKGYFHNTGAVLEHETRKEDVLYRLQTAQVPVNGSRDNINANGAQRFNHEINTQNPFQSSYGMNMVGALLPGCHNPRSDSNAAAVSYNQQLPCTSTSKILAMQSSCHGNVDSDQYKFLNNLSDHCRPSSSLTTRRATTFDRTSDELLYHFYSLPTTTISSLSDAMFIAEAARGQCTHTEGNPETSQNAHPKNDNEVLATDTDNFKEDGNGENSKERQ